MDEHTSHELAYKKGYDKGYNKGYADALEYAMSVINDIKRDVDAILKMCRLCKGLPSESQSRRKENELCQYTNINVCSNAQTPLE